MKRSLPVILAGLLLVIPVAVIGGQNKPGWRSTNAILEAELQKGPLPESAILPNAPTSALSHSGAKRRRDDSPTKVDKRSNAKTLVGAGAGQGEFSSMAVTTSQTLESAHFATPEITALAGALGNDPLLIYEWVRNNIEYSPYFGFRRGAHLTLLDRVGNDFDQSALLVALLHEAGITATYRYGWVEITKGETLSNWMGLEAPYVQGLLELERIPVLGPPFTTSQYLVFARVWVVARIAGQDYPMDPGFKRHTAATPIDLASLCDYSATTLRSVTGGVEDSNSIRNVEHTALRTKLAEWTTQAVESARLNHHSLSGADLAGSPKIQFERMAQLPSQLPGGQVILGTPDVYDAFPSVANFATCFWVSVNGTETIWPLCELRGAKLSVEFSTTNLAQLWLGDTLLFAEASLPPDPSEPVNIEYGFTYPVGMSMFDSEATSHIQRGQTTVIAYGMGAAQQRLNESLRLDAELGLQGISASDRRVLTERLQIIGLQYQNQHSFLSKIVGGLSHNYYQIEHFAGLVKQATAPSVDLPLNLHTSMARDSAGLNWTIPYGVLTFWASGLEHVTLNQTAPVGAYSTVSILEHALSQGLRVYLATPANYAAVTAQLTDYGVTFDTAPIDAMMASAAGGRLLIAEDCSIPYNNVPGAGGYMSWDLNTNSIGQMITGGLNGGLPTVANDLSVVTSNSNAQAAATVLNPPKGSDPVDLTSGAFLLDSVDLAVGKDEPEGLKLTRNYNSQRRASDPAGLGRGWTHGYDLRFQYRYPNDIDIAKVGAAEVMPFLIATKSMLDVFGPANTSVRDWVIPVLAVNWGLDQLISSRAAVTMGANTIEFVKLPDGSFVPPTNLAVTLTKAADGSHALSFRHGNTIHFRATDGKFDTIKDPFNNTLNATYNGSNQLSTVTDSYNRTFTFNYSGAQLTGVSDNTDSGRSVGYSHTGGNFIFTDAEGKSQTLYMDAGYRLTKVADARGRTVVENDYDAWSRVKQQRTFGDTTRLTKMGIAPGLGIETDPLGHMTRTYYDARGSKIAFVDQLGQATTWQYDGVNRLTKTISAKGFTTTYGYDANHVMVSETNPAGHTRTITPDLWHRPSIVENFEGQQTTFEYWNTTSAEIKKITAPGDIVTEFTYDNRGRVFTAHPAAYATGQVDTYAYDANGHVDTITHPADANTGDQDLDDYTYNTRGDLIELIDRKDVRTTYEYNNRRQPRKVIQWEGSTQRVTETVYDDAGDVDYTLDASGRKVDSEHDALGHLTQIKRGPIANQVVTLANSYSDPRTLLTTSTDALGNAVAYTYYATQQLATVKDPLLRTTTLGYDEDQRPVTSQTPLGFLTTSLLDSRGFKDGTQDAENQLTDYTYDKDGRMTVLANRLNKAFGWSYNDAARTVSSTTPTGKTTTTVASTRGLPASVQEPSTQTTTFNTYDAEGRLLSKTDGVGTTTYTYWPNGLLKQVTENGHTTTRTYDALNRLQSYQDGEGNTLGYTYHPSGELATITYPGNKTVTYTYDDFGRLRTVTDWSSRVTTYTYDNASRLTRIDRPNGTYRVQEYDAASQLRFIKEFKSDNTIITFQELKYDNDGRITSSFIHPKPAAVTLASDDLLYDDDNRLSTWNAQSVVFDADGNMTTGPLPSGTLGAYGYDSRNRLTSAGGSTYCYNPDGLRVAITGVGAATFVIDPNAALSRTLMRTKGGTTTYYVYGLGLLYEETNGATLTYHADQVGSTLALTNGSGTVTDRWTYTPYGAIASHTVGTSDTPFQFNGEMGVQTDDNGLYHMRARYYNPRLMRFCNADPIGFGGGLNWYAAFGNDPVSRTDPFGLKDAKNDPNNTVGAVAAGMVITAPFPTTTGSPTPKILDALGQVITRAGSLVRGAAGTIGGTLIFIFTPTSAGDSELHPPGYSPSAMDDILKLDARMQPVPGAVGPHTTFKVGPNGEITNYQDWYPQTNPQNPNPWQPGTRVDVTGKSHDGIPTPHVHEPSGTVRPAGPGELPGNP